MPPLDTVKKLIVDLDIDNIAKAVEDALKTTSPLDVLKAMSEAMLKVGDLYEKKEYYLPELVLAGETMETAMIVLRPKLKAIKVEKKGTVIACTVKGDLHDIGKNIVVTMLTAAGYNVIDLGKDIDSKVIAQKAKETKADIIALSALLTMTVVEIENVVKELKAIGLRDKVKIICGGAPLNQELANKLGADIAADDAVQGIEICNKIMAAKAKAK
jgi:methylmalonyl-CoA mutase cobalamin-binding domain/chain